jgi:alkylhydroperoxidase family enzyme
VSKIKGLREDLPGIVSLFEYRPDVAEYMRGLVEVTLRKSSLKPEVAEALAGFASNLNGCKFCEQTHAHASIYLGGTYASLADQKVARAATLVGVVVGNENKHIDEAISNCREVGFTEENIHDLVLIGSVFSMLNRYVCLLTTNMGTEQEHEIMGQHMAEHGYITK